MKVTVVATDDAGTVLDQAGDFLASDPVRHNVILTLLSERRRQPAPGRYWYAVRDAPVGVVFQSPLHYPATLTPMPSSVVAELVDAIAGAGIELPAITGEAATAASFAGQWTERHKSAATPVQGQRIYEVRQVTAPAGVAGHLRPAAAADRALLVDWVTAFHDETGEPRGDVERLVDRRLPAGHFWLWDDDGPVSMAALAPEVGGVVRVQAVYTPPEARAHGYASAGVAALSEATLARGLRCILYTDLANPTSNSVYRRIGYHAVSEVLRYRFD